MAAHATASSNEAMFRRRLDGMPKTNRLAKATAKVDAHPAARRDWALFTLLPPDAVCCYGERDLGGTTNAARVGSAGSLGGQA